MENDWLNGLKNRMEGYEEPAPEGLWEEIESAARTRERTRGAVILPWLSRSVAAAAVIALGVFIGVKLSDKGETRVAAVADSTVRQEGQVSPHTISSSVNTLGNLTASVNTAKSVNTVKRRSAAKPVEVVTVSGESSLIALAEKSESGLSEPVVEEYHSPEAVNEPASAEKPDVKENSGFETTHDREDWSKHLSVTRGKDNVKEERHSDIGLSVSGAATNSKNVSEFNVMRFYRGPAPVHIPSNDVSGGASNGTPGDGDLLMTMRKAAVPLSSTVTSETNHRRPARLAMTFNFPMGRVLGVETGLTYTKLFSTFTTKSESTVNEDAQTLQYLGVPLNLTASVFERKLISLYLSGGGMIEKCLSGKIETSVKESGSLVGGVTSSDLRPEPLLWSLNAAAGVQINFGRNLGVYAEPGVSYHFKDGTDTQTIYKEHPFDFMMTFGLRVSFN